MNYQHRDVKIIDLNLEKKIAISCDSCGGIGDKPEDRINVPLDVTGMLTARVCLMELISIGAKPKVITINICNEPYPTGQEILKGITQEISNNKLTCELIISTEKNIQTSMTALGVTTMGAIDNDDIRAGKVNSGNKIYVLGVPYVGNEVVEMQNNLPTLQHIQEILKDWKTTEILPIGSSGIKKELDKLSEAYNLQYELVSNLPINIHKSGGPCTAIIIISSEDLNLDYNIPFNYIGCMK